MGRNALACVRDALGRLARDGRMLVAAIGLSMAFPFVALAANTPPTVSITAPANNSTFASPASVSLQATAAAKTAGATITKVVFYYASSTVIGTVTSAPYSYSWTGMAAGSYSVTAKATDSLGQVTTSTAIAVKINAAPTVSISSPTSSTSFTAPASIPITATATAKASGATISKVDFYNNGVLLGTSTTSPYTYTWTGVATGTYPLTAKATDSLGSVTTSAAVSVTVKAPPAPTVSLTAPATGASFTAPGTIAMTATATAKATGATISKVEFFNTGVLVGTATASPYTYTLTNVSVGSYSLTAKATDSLGAATTSSAVAVTVKAPAAPTVSLTAPTSGSSYTGPATIVLKASATAKASGATISKVDFFNGSTLLGTATSSPYAVTWPTVLGGTYSLTAKATDSLGSVTTSSAVSVSVSFTTGPTVSLTSPPAGATYSAFAPIVMNALASPTASGAGLAKVEFYAGSVLVGTSTTPPYTTTWMNATPGTYSLQAKATDSYGVSTITGATSVTVIAAPIVSITSPAQDSQYAQPGNFTIAASVTPSAGTTISQVDFFSGNTWLGTSASAPYSFNWTAVPGGDYYVSAKATDSLGHVGTSPSTHVVVDGGDSCANAPPLAAAGSKGGANMLARLKPTFEANVGQARTGASFVTRSAGLQLALGARRVELQAVSRIADGTREAARVGLSLVHSNPAARPVGEAAAAEKSNYIIGSDPSKWRLGVPHFERVRYAGVYSGIDQVFYGTIGQFEYDFVVHPSADPRQIRVAVEGARKLALSTNGDLVMSTEAGTLTQKRPVAYQEIDGRRQPVRARYRLVARNEVSIELGRYDPARELVIDPVLVYSTFLGATDGASWVNAIALSRCGEAYVAGGTYGTDFPIVPGSYSNKVPAAGMTGFVAKVNQSGTGLLYSTYFGGNLSTEIRNLAIDDQGHAYFSGTSPATDLPLTAGSLPAPQGAQWFVAKLAAGGASLMYSTRFGGSPGYFTGDGIYGLAVDTDGNAYLTGTVSAPDFAYTAGAMAVRGPGYRVGAFVSKLNPTGTALVYSTYLGGQGASIDNYGDQGRGIAVDAGGNAYVTGVTYSSDFPTTAGSFMQTNQAYASSRPDGFAVKLNASGSALVYGTYIGSNMGNQPSGIALDLAGRAYVTGSYEETAGIGSHYTRLSNQPANSGVYSGFVTRLTADGTDLDYFTGFGGIYCDTSRSCSGGTTTQTSAIAVDSGTGNVWVAGTTNSNQWPLVKPLPSSNFVLFQNPYVLKLNASGDQILFSTYLNGQTVAPIGTQHFSGAAGAGVVIDSVGSAYVAGRTNMSDFPTTVGALQTTFGANAGTTGFVVKINETKDTVTHLSASPSQPIVGLPTNLVATIDGNVPTGLVTFKEGTNVLGTASVSAGEASLSVSFAAGTHTISASYPGDANNNPSDSSAVTLGAVDPSKPPTVSQSSITDGMVLYTDSTGKSTPQVAVVADASPGSLLNALYINYNSSYTWWNHLNMQHFSGSASLQALSPGVYTLYCQANDNYGNLASSPAVRFSVVTAGLTPPTVAMTSPAAGTSIQSPGAVTFTATATPTSGATITSVGYYQGSTYIGSSSTSPYSLTWSNPPPGTYSVIALARDSNGATAWSAPASITVTSAPLPTVALTSPSNATTLSAPASVTVSANAAGVNGATVSKVEFFQNGALLAAVTAPPYTYTVNNLASGSYFFTAKATDSRGYASVSDAAGVAVGNVDGAPAVSIVSPTSYAAFGEPASVTVDAAAFALNGASVAKVEFFDGQQLLGTVASSPYRFVWDKLAAGGYSIVAKVTDSNGVTSSSVPANFVVNQTLPLALAIAAPLTAAQVSDDHVNVAGTVHAPPNSAISVNGVLGSILSDGTFFVNSVPLSMGGNTLTASVVTVDGDSLAQSVTVNRNGTAPFQIHASGSDGLSPTQLLLEWTNTSGADVTHLDVSCADNGSVQYTTKDITTDVGTYCNYSSGGNTRARVNVYAKSAGGAETLIYSDSWQVKVDSGPARYALVRGVLFQLMSRLKAGDTTGALKLFSPGPAQYYQSMFNAIGAPSLAKMIDYLGRIEQTSLSDTSTEFLLIRPSAAGGFDAFEAGLMLGNDGLWRIEGL